MQCRVVKTKQECCTGSSVVLCLFRNELRSVVGWYIGPLDVQEHKIDLHYLPKRAAVLGPVAVLRALTLAEDLGIELIVYDPEDLLPEAWRV